MAIGLNPHYAPLTSRSSFNSVRGAKWTVPAADAFMRFPWIPVVSISTIRKLFVMVSPWQLKIQNKEH